MPDGVGASDRLPWLSDTPAARSVGERKPRQGAKGRELAGWVVAGLLVIAGASYWVGTQSIERALPRAIRTSVPVILKPAPRAPEPFAAEPQVRIAGTPEVRPAAAPEVSIPGAVQRQVSRPQLTREAPPAVSLDSTVAAQSGQAPKAAPAATSAPAGPTQQPLKLWPSRQVKGANGRLVQIGAFGSTHQAKLGWRHMQQAYPAVGGLPAVVVESRNSKGRTFYRFQIGTTSQAHSEVLCQRMEKIGLSCAVIGLAWKEKVER